MHVPRISPLKKTLDIELFNKKWFNKPFQIYTPKLVYDHDTLKFPDEYFPPFLSVSENRNMPSKTINQTRRLPFPPLFSSYIV